MRKNTTSCFLFTLVGYFCWCLLRNVKFVYVFLYFLSATKKKRFKCIAVLSVYWSLGAVPRRYFSNVDNMFSFLVTVCFWPLYLTVEQLHSWRQRFITVFEFQEFNDLILIHPKIISADIARHASTAKFRIYWRVGVCVFFF